MNRIHIYVCNFNQRIQATFGFQKSLTSALPVEMTTDNGAKFNVVKVITNAVSLVTSQVSTAVGIHLARQITLQLVRLDPLTGLSESCQPLPSLGRSKG